MVKIVEAYSIIKGVSNIIELKSSLISKYN